MEIFETLQKFVPTFLFEGLSWKQIFLTLVVMSLAYIIVVMLVESERTISVMVTILATFTGVLFFAGFHLQKQAFVPYVMSIVTIVVIDLVVGLFWSWHRYRQTAILNGRRYRAIWLSWLVEKNLPEDTNLESLNYDQKTEWNTRISSKMKKREYTDCNGDQKGPNHKEYYWAISCWLLFPWADAPYYLFRDRLEALFEWLRDFYFNIGASGFADGVKEVSKGEVKA